MINNTKYEISCPKLTLEQKCNFYKNPNDYEDCSPFSDSEDLCCFATINATTVKNFCYWNKDDLNTSYGNDTAFYQNYTIDTIFAINNNLDILQINPYDTLVKITGMKTCYGTKDPQQSNCSKTDPVDQTACANSNTKTNLCCLLINNITNTMCIWSNDTSYINIITNVTFNNKSYIRDCRISKVILTKPLISSLILIIIILIM